MTDTHTENRYLFLGGDLDGTWRPVVEGTLHITIPTGRGTTQLYSVQGWSGDGRHIHRIFVHQLKPHQVFERLMAHYHPSATDAAEHSAAALNGSLQ